MGHIEYILYNKTGRQGLAMHASTSNQTIINMSLIQRLRGANYDFIDSPIRNHKVQQIWLKRSFENVQFYMEHVSHAFTSGVQLEPVQDPALSVNATETIDYKLNIGLSVLDELLSAIGLSELELSGKVGGSGTIKVSYNNAYTLSVPSGNVDQYFGSADFSHPNRRLLKDANRKNLIFINGILMAKGLKVEVESNKAFEVGLEVGATPVANGSLDFSRDSESTLVMTSNRDLTFPVAVQALRLDWDRGAYDKSNVVTDGRNWF